MVTMGRDDAPEEFPEIVCLCGSTRFYAQFQEVNYRLTMRGKIVLAPGFYRSQLAALERGGERYDHHGESIGCTPEEKIMLDELHKRKIDISNRVYVINVNGYIGDSTRSEIQYAHRRGVPVEYLEGGRSRRVEKAIDDL